jgi:hypothetical protein
MNGIRSPAPRTAAGGEQRPGRARRLALIAAPFSGIIERVGCRTTDDPDLEYLGRRQQGA